MTQTSMLRRYLRGSAADGVQAGIARVWQRLRRDPVLGLTVGYFAVILLVAATGNRLAPFDPQAQEPVARLLPPLGVSATTGRHWLGTDQLGRDLLSGIVAASRLTVLIGLLTTLLGGLLGATLGMAAGYYGGQADRLIMRLTEAQTAMPMFLVAILFLAVTRGSWVNLIAILPSLVWPAFARITRAEVMRMRASPFIEAARLIGCSDGRVLFRHILPNLRGQLAVLFVIEIAYVMLAEAGLSFLGVGVQPPELTWGLLIAVGRPYLAVAWWIAILPGLVLAFTVFCLNLLARRLETGSGGRL